MGLQPQQEREKMNTQEEIRWMMEEQARQERENAEAEYSQQMGDLNKPPGKDGCLIM